MRILALDWGTVRIGAAVSDPDGKIAFPLEKFIESKHAVEEIKKIVAELEIEKIVIGIPKTLGGAESDSTQRAKDFAAKLASQVPCSFDYVDERLSSVGAGKTLQGMGISQKNQRSMVDNMAAQQMLQTYLDTKN